MGKVREESSPKVAKADSGKDQSSRSRRGWLVPFFMNFLRATRYKPSQGKNARLWSAIGLGVVFAAGLYTYHERYLAQEEILTRSLILTPIALACAWIVWRVVEFPPFVDFLIATEAEMTKVSWTTKDELTRATLVVLTTVLILSVFLAGVDVVWSLLLKTIGVLKFGGDGAFGSQAG